MMRRVAARPRLLGAAVALVVLVGTGGGVACAVSAGTPAGPRSDGTGITPVGFRVAPAGQQTTLRGLPLGEALSPDGSVLLVSNDGDGAQSLQVVDPHTSAVVQTITYQAPHALFVGVAFSPDGHTAYAAGGGENVVHVYSVSGLRLTETQPIKLPAAAAPGLFPAGLAVTPDGQRLVIADHLADAVTVVQLTTGEMSTVRVGHTPWGVAVSPDSRTAYVSNQGDKTVSVVRLGTLLPDGPTVVTKNPVFGHLMITVTGTIGVGEHPNALRLTPDGKRLFVACAESDEVDVVDTTSATVTAKVDLAPYAGAPVGTSPVSLALAPDGGRLYVADAGNNDVAVVDLTTDQVAGLVPTAWYPTAVLATSDQLFVLNGKGLGAGPDTHGQYIAAMMVGSLSTVALPLSDATLGDYTQQVTTNDGFGQAQQATAPASIKHVIYVVQENRAYDQVLGSLGKGNGDPTLNLFGDESATNTRALQRRFVTLDNFYADAEVSAQGWNWVTQANSNLYKESLWPEIYSGRKSVGASDNPDIAIDVDPANTANRNATDSFIWDRLADAGVSFRNYGFYVDEGTNAPFVSRDPRLNAATDHAYRGFDLNCPDNPDTFAPLKATCGTPRITEWQREFQGYVTSGNLPTVEFVRLPNDHTAGTTPGAPTPRAYVADNDLALGRLVDTVSHSPFWSSTAIFVTEDDAQDGVDHVDAHRTVSQVISPYTQTGQVDSTFYSTASILRSIENIVGIAPLTQFDAFAAPMSASFSALANTAPYTALRPGQAANLLNGATAPLADEAAGQPLAHEDQVNDDLFTLEVWQSVRGAGSTPPGRSDDGTAAPQAAPCLCTGPAAGVR